MGAANGSAASGQGGMGSVSIGRLRQGKQGLAVRQSVQDGSLLVNADRRGSFVGNPFVAAPVRRLCAAYDELLLSVLRVPIAVEEEYHLHETLRHRDASDKVTLSQWEEELLRSIAKKHRVKIHDQRIRPLDVRAWLVYHASILVGGQSLCLLCWCVCGGSELPSGMCHTQSLAGALRWLSHARGDELRALQFTSTCGACDVQVCALPAAACVHALPFPTLPSWLGPCLRTMPVRNGLTNHFLRFRPFAQLVAPSM